MIRPSDVGFFLSTRDPSATPSPVESLGGFASSVRVSTQVRGNLFADLSGPDNAARAAEYRCIFVRNGHRSLVLRDARAWLAEKATGGAEVFTGPDPTPPSIPSATEPQAVAIADRRAAPAGVEFAAPVTYEGGLRLGDLGPGQVRGLWIRRRGRDSAPVDDDGFVLRVEGESGA